jgi:hypothetical protein
MPGLDMMVTDSNSTKAFEIAVETHAEDLVKKFLSLLKRVGDRSADICFPHRESFPTLSFWATRLSV